jgi:hypothetical protein
LRIKLYGKKSTTTSFGDLNVSNSYSNHTNNRYHHISAPAPLPSGPCPPRYMLAIFSSDSSS